MTRKSSITTIWVEVFLLLLFSISQPWAGTKTPPTHNPDNLSVNPGETPTIALVMKALSNPFFSKMREGAKRFARVNNLKLDVFGVERETDVELQISQVENILLRGYDAIVIAPSDSRKLVPVCKRALDKGIVVINIDNPLNQDELRKYSIDIPFVGSDNNIGAAMVGDYLRQKMGGTGNVLVIEGIRGVENADLRKTGFIEAVTQDSDIRILASESANWHTDEAFSLTTKMLEKYPNVHAVFSANDNMALGVLQALQLQGLDQQILIGSYDNIDLVREQMRNGSIHATVEQHPELMGEYGVDLAWKAVQGQKIARKTVTPLDLITYEGFNQKIALSIPTLDNQFFADLILGAQQSADLFGSELTIFDSHNNVAEQLSSVIGIINNGYSTLIINPTDSSLIISGIEMANQHKIPVITVDRASLGGQIRCHIGSDNYKGGEIAGKAMVRYLKGRGNVVELEGIPGASATQDRAAGFNHIITQNPGIKIVARESANFDRHTAQQTINRLLDNHINFDAIFAHNDYMILGALDALKQKKNGSKILIGFDGISEALEEINNGRVTATVSQQPTKIGWVAVQRAIEISRGTNFAQNTLVELELKEK